MGILKNGNKIEERDEPWKQRSGEGRCGEVWRSFLEREEMLRNKTTDGIVRGMRLASAAAVGGGWCGGRGGWCGWRRWWSIEFAKKCMGCLIHSVRQSPPSSLYLSLFDFELIVGSLQYMGFSSLMIRSIYIVVAKVCNWVDFKYNEFGVLYSLV